jgi:uncharacterized protein
MSADTELNRELSLACVRLKTKPRTYGLLGEDDSDMTDADRLLFEMTEFDKCDPARIQHFMKVYEYAHMIGVGEGLAEKEMHILEAAAILHDIGIIPCEKKYGYCNGKLQEEEGPHFAKEILERIGYAANETERICYLIGHHHTYSDVDGIDYRILIEADFLVNALEGQMKEEVIRTVGNNIFKTKTGRHLLCLNFGVYVP